jgi:hypothetical protein
VALEDSTKQLSIDTTTKMSNELAHKAKRRIIGRPSDWIKPFDIEDYTGNPPMIEKLYEEKQLALATSIDLGEQVSNLSKKVHELELEKQKLSTKLDTARKRSYIPFALSFVAAISAGIGANIATDKPFKWVGWVMIALAGVLELIVFLESLQQRRD